jgi:hypothetical protein
VTGGSRLMMRRYVKVILANGGYSVLFSENHRWWLAT